MDFSKYLNPLKSLLYVFLLVLFCFSIHEASLFHIYTESESLFEEGEQFRTRGDFAKAIQFYKEVGKWTPEMEQAQKALLKVAGK